MTYLHLAVLPHLLNAWIPSVWSIFTR